MEIIVRSRAEHLVEGWQDGAESVDLVASYARYLKLIEEALQARFPEADIETRPGESGVNVYSGDDGRWLERETEVARDVLREVYDAQGWLVTR